MKRTLVVLAILVTTCLGKSGDIDKIEDYGWVGGESAHGGIYMSRWHDHQSGVEFICAQTSRWNNDAGLSCFLTGRKW